MRLTRDHGGRGVGRTVRGMHASTDAAYAMIVLIVDYERTALVYTQVCQYHNVCMLTGVRGIERVSVTRPHGPRTGATANSNTSATVHRPHISVRDRG